MSSLVIVKVVKLLKFRIKLKIDDSVNNTISTPIDNKTTDSLYKKIDNNITLTINKSLDLKDDQLKETVPDDSMSNVAFKKNIDNGKHFVSFVILYPFQFDSNLNLASNFTTKKLVGLNVLLIRQNIIPSYEIKYTKDFKYKKFIREKMLNEFKYKNKDISIIKSINVFKNYHNYVVLMNKCSIRHKQYSNSLQSPKDKFSWRQMYDWIDLSMLDNISADCLCKKTYEYLNENSKLSYFYTDNLEENYIHLNNIYSVLSQIS